MSIFKDTIKDNVIDFLQMEKGRIQQTMLMERMKKKPDLDRERGLAIALNTVGELQNRLIDNYWKD